MTVPPPPSYATADSARAYIARVLSRAAAKPPPSPPRVYLIVYPKLRANTERWARLEPGLRGAMRGAELVDYRTALGRRQHAVYERVGMIGRRCQGALVVPYASRRPEQPVRYLLGYPARLEAQLLADAGLPVLVFTPRGLAAWPDVLVRPAGEHGSPWLTLELRMPELPAEPLPTVAASFRALGLEPPAPDRRAPDRRAPPDHPGR